MLILAFHRYVWPAEVEYNMHLTERYITWVIYISGIYKYWKKYLDARGYFLISFTTPALIHHAKAKVKPALLFLGNPLLRHVLVAGRYFDINLFSSICKSYPYV